MRLIDALSESQWDYFINCIYDCCNALGAPDNINANCLIDWLSNMEINAVPAPNYRVPSTEEWMERYCTKKQLAGYEKRKKVLTDGLLQSFVPIPSKRNQQCQPL